MKPYLHAKSSVKKYGGVPEDYLDIHDFMDSSKATIADVRHRAILHSAFGCFIVEKVFGVMRKNSAGKEYSVRDVAEDHIMEDLGFIPSVEKWFEGLPIAEWMGGKGKKTTKIPFGLEEIILPPTTATPPNIPYPYTPPKKDDFFDGAYPPFNPSDIRD